MGKVLSVFDVSTINITWGSLHILLTLAIYITLIIFIWITKIDPCRDSQICDDIKNKDLEFPRNFRVVEVRRSIHPIY